MENLKLYQDRALKLSAEMQKKGVACMIICNSPNLYYMTGYAPKKCERLQIAFFPVDSEPLMVVPAIYAFNAEKECSIRDQRVWTDGDDLFAFVKGIMEEKGLLGRTLAIDDTFEYRQLSVIQHVSPDSVYVLGSSVITELRMRKSPEEIELMKISGKLSDDAVQMVLDNLLDGRSEGQLKSWIEYDLANKGMIHGFSNLIASGPNTANSHHVSNETVPKPGDAVYFDLGGAYSHYWSDITRSAHIGKPSDRYVECYNRVREAQQLAFEAIKPGVRACDVDKVARDYLKKYNLGEYFTHRLGHGIGLDGHELPNLSPDNTLVLEPGMSFSCEPGVYFNNEFGIRIEDSVVVTDSGAMSFNHFTKELIIL